MSDTKTALEVIDLCSSDEELSDQEVERQIAATFEPMSPPLVSLDCQMESSQNTNISIPCVNSHNEEEDSIANRKLPAEIDLTGEESSSSDQEENDCSSSIHPNYAAMPPPKKYRGGGQGSSRNVATIAQDDETASAPSPPTTIRIVLEKDGRVKDTGILQEGMMDLLYQLNQTTIPIPAKLCSRHVSSSSVSNPYAKKKKRTCRKPSTVRWIQQQENWSCGYRSLQMILTALLPSLPRNHAYYQMVPSRADHVAIPSLGQIQATLEQAWREGYDPQGARHYRQRILGNTGKPGELGAIEISSIMTYWGLDATVVQFVNCHPSRRLLPLFVKSYFAKALGKEDCPYCCGHGSTMDSAAPTWISVGTNGRLDSFAMASKILQFAEASLSIEETCDCPVLPLYLQWEGHSVTIVGYHEQNGSLLVFDSMKKVPNTIGDSKTNPPKHLWNTFQLDPEYLRNRDTQIILSSYKSISLTEKENRRDHTGVITAAEEDVLRAIAASRSG